MQYEKEKKKVENKQTSIGSTWQLMIEEEGFYSNEDNFMY